MIGEIIGMFFCCAAVPFFLITVAVSIGEGIYRAAAMRGVEAGRYHCAKCRYNVHGIGSWNCPECGSDLREVGLKTRKEQPVFSIYGRVILWSAAMFPGAVLICGMTLALVPSRNEKLFYDYLVDSAANPASSVVAGSLEIEIDARGIGWGASPTLEWVDIYTWDNNNVRHDLASYEVGDTTWYAPGLWLTVLQQHNIGPDDAARQAYADDLALYVAALADEKTSDVQMRRLKSDYAPSTYTDSITSPYEVLLGFVLSVLLWGVVLIWIVRVWNRSNKAYYRRQRQAVEEFGRIAGISDQ